MSVFPGAVPPTGSASASDTLAAAGHTALHNVHSNETNALATKVGTGTSTPTSGMVLRGNGVGTSAWAQVNQATDVTGVLPQANGGTGTTLATGTGKAVYDTSPTLTSPTVSGLTISSVTDIIAALKVIYPIGCIYIETTGTNPATTFGFGTWVAYGAGRTMIGVGTSDQAFASGVTGGESNHTLTSSEIPNFTIQIQRTAGGAATRIQVDGTGNTAFTTELAQTGGGGASHNTLPPYIVTYFWKRTA